MNIAINTYNPYRTSFGALKPLKDYKGPLLKLTVEDNAKIAVHQETINRCMHEIMQIEGQQRHMPTCEVKNQLGGIIDKLEFEIERAQQYIRDIKINRFNLQKSEINK